MTNNNIIQFPLNEKTFIQLEKEIMQAIENEMYDIAVGKIDTLLEHQYKTNDLNKHKLYCLSHLNRWPEIEQLAEPFVQHRQKELDFIYVKYYLTSLLHQNQYELAINVVEEMIENRTLSKIEQRTVQEIYEQCKAKITLQSTDLLEKLQLAIAMNNEQDQWIIFNNWTKLHAKPPHFFKSLLAMPSVHPMIKTEIISLLQAKKFTEEIAVEKFTRKMTFYACDLLPVHLHPAFLLMMDRIDDMEQKNMTLFQFMKELFERYSEVIYPFFYESRDAQIFLKALEIVATSFYHNEKAHFTKENIDEKTLYYINEIEKCNEIYLKMLII